MIPFLEKAASKRLKSIANSLKIHDTDEGLFLNQRQCHAMGIHLDYTYQHINSNILSSLVNLAQESRLSESIQALMQGDNLNKSEKIPALHTALRDFDKKNLYINGRDVLPDILNNLEKMRLIINQIRAGEWVGYTGKKIAHIVNIGIGGSDLGMRFCIQALKEFSSSSLQYLFISDADPNAFKNTVSQLNPETTLFIISSKSFTTPETLYNAQKAFNWVHHKEYKARHFIAVTANPERAKATGIQHILEIWDWIGGRYSLCSAINLITAIAIGFEQFAQLLAGAHEMDQHFKQAPMDNNLPVLLALLGIWNINFLQINNLLILTYLQELQYFVPYIQQLDMESNGKSIDNQGNRVDYSTGPIVWGGMGNQAQHSYYQLLCQGTHKITADLISTDLFEQDLINELCQHKIRIMTKGVLNPLNAHHFIPGKIPLNHIRLTACTPKIFGSLIALYEHKIFAQSVIWDINPFDQPGVESSKRFRDVIYSNNMKQVVST